MDIYTTNGNIIREFPEKDGISILELEFLFDNLFWSRLFSMAIYYIVFFENLKINYVQTSHTYAKIAIKQIDLTKEAKQELIKVMLAVKDNSILLRAMADKLLFNQPDVGNVDTCADQALLPRKVVEVKGKIFLKEFADALRKTAS